MNLSLRASLPPALTERINEQCDRFESAWKTAPRPRLEDFVSLSTEPERTLLLRELILLDLAYRRRNGDKPLREEYASWFPDQPDRVQVLFEAAGLTEPETVDGAATPEHEASTLGVKAPPGKDSVAPPGYEILDTEKQIPERIARFQVRRWLGEGAFGAVYEAYDPQLDRAVAIKVAKLDRGDSAQLVKRFLREAKTAAGLRHPHIVPVYEFGQEGDHFYIVSAFIQGRTLQADLAEPKQKNEPIDLRRAVRLVQQLADAMAYAHGQGIVHRDVKPANVMLDDKDEPMLMDFGLATRQEEAEKLTHAGAVLGTPLYMSPEQARGKGAEAGPPSDQYSLGVMLYEMIAGQPPFHGTPELVMFHHMETEPISPRKHNPVISRDLETICLKCLEKEPEKRYLDCEVLAEDMRRWVKGEPIVARPIRCLERLPRNIVPQSGGVN